MTVLPNNYTEHPVRARVNREDSKVAAVVLHVLRHCRLLFKSGEFWCQDSASRGPELSIMLAQHGDHAEENA